MSEKVIIEIDVNAGDAIVEIEKLKIAIKEQNAIMRTFGKDTDEFKNAAIKARSLKEEVKVLTQATNQQIKETNAVKGSMKELGLQLAANREKYRNLSEAERNNAAIGGQLLNTIQQQDAKIKQLDATLGNHQRNVGDYQKALQGMGNQFMTIFSAAGLANLATSALTSAFQGIKQWIGGATEAFIRQENAVTKLKFAIDGNITLLEKYKARASEIQKQTVFGDEQLLEVMAYASALKLNEERTNALVDASIQLATVSGQDVMSAAQMLSKTLTGEVTRSLQVYVTETKNLSKEQIKNGAVVDLVAEKYKGFAEAQALTSVGALKQLQNELSDTQEEMGQHTIKFEIYWEKLKGVLASEANSVVEQVSLITSMFTGFNDMVEEATIKFNQQKAVIAQNITVYAELTNQKKEDVALTLKNAKTQSEILKIYSEIVNTVNAQKEAVKGLSEEEIKAAEEARKAKAEKLQELERLRIEIMDDSIEKEKATEELRYQEYIKKWGETEEALILHNQKMAAIDKTYADAAAAKQADEQDAEIKAIADYNKQLEAWQAAVDKAREDRTNKQNEEAEKQRAKELQDAKEKLDTIQQYSQQLTEIANTAIDENGFNLKKFGKALSIFTLDILRKQAQAAVAASVAGSLATPASVATGGAAGLVQAGILTALIEAAFGIAKGIISKEPQGLATGTTNVTKSGVFKVGEDGPELAYLPQGAAVVPNSLLDFKNFGTFAAPQMASNEAALIQALRHLQVIATIQDINAVAKSEAVRMKIGKI